MELIEYLMQGQRQAGREVYAELTKQASVSEADLREITNLLTAHLSDEGVKQAAAPVPPAPTPNRVSAAWASIPEAARRAIVSSLIGGTALGAISGAGHYSSSRPMQSGESLNEIAARSLRRKLQETNEARGGDPGYLRDLTQEYAQSAENLAAVDRRHPAASSLLAALIGGAGGAGVGAATSLLRR